MNEQENTQAERELDRLLSEAAADARAVEAPRGFAGAVMASIARGDGVVNGGARGGGTSGRLVVAGIAAALAVCAGAFFAGMQYANNTSRVENAQSEAPPSNNNTPENPGARGADGNITIDQIASDMGAHEDARSGKANSKKPSAPQNYGKGPTQDAARGGGSAPSTVAGRFPRSSDGRVYVVMDLRTADIALPASAQAVGGGEFAPPSVDGYVMNRWRMSVDDAASFLFALDLKYKNSIRPHLAGFDGLVPVTGVVTPPRIGGDGSPPAASAPAEGRRAVELVVYTLAK